MRTDCINYLTDLPSSLIVRSLMIKTAVQYELCRRLECRKKFGKTRLLALSSGFDPTLLQRFLFHHGPGLNRSPQVFLPHCMAGLWFISTATNLQLRSTVFDYCTNKSYAARDGISIHSRIPTFIIIRRRVVLSWKRLQR